MSNYNVVLPASGPKPSYYKAYVMYLRNILDYNGVSYVLKGNVNTGEVVYPTATKYLMKLDDKRIVIDYSDHLDIMPNWAEFDAYFKFHYNSDKHKMCNTIYPFAPISFYEWNKYQSLKNTIEYKCSGDLIVNIQRIGGNAVKTRTKVQNMLKKKYNDLVITGPTMDQKLYWELINSCLVHVFAPGARNNMIDRGHMQYLAFGCCTIAPPIVDEFPYDGKMVDGVNYILCDEDYSNLIEKIEWCKNNRDKCVEIGQNAKNLFELNCTPKKLWNWILEKI